MRRWGVSRTALLQHVNNNWTLFGINKEPRIVKLQCPATSGKPRTNDQDTAIVLNSHFPHMFICSIFPDVMNHDPQYAE